MSTNLEYIEREKQRKRERRRQDSEAQREKERQRARARDKKTKETFFVGRTTWKICSGHQGENERQWKKSEQEHDTSAIKHVTSTFLEVSRCNRAKQRQRNVQKCVIGHFKVLCSVLWPLNRSEAGGYKPSGFSYVNDHVHGLVSMRIPRFAHVKQEGL